MTDPNRSFSKGRKIEKYNYLTIYIADFDLSILYRVDLYEDTDNSVFRPALENWNATE
jgi:hypothetical protein